MCGIHAVLSYFNKQQLIEYCNNVKNLSARGPDDHKTYSDPNIIMNFFRLSINGIGSGAQPMIYKNYVLMCNGEIYNHKQLEELIDYKNTTGSDCEIITPLFEKYGIEKTCTLLDGVFAFIIWDSNKKELYVGRDRFGVRPLYYCNENNILQISSELKGMNITGTVSHFPPAHYGIINNTYYTEIKIKPYYLYSWNENPVLKNDYRETLYCIYETLNTAVKKRMMTERPVGCLVSGGLDSSLIAGLVRKFLPKEKQLRTFSIGFEGSPDLKNARLVANYLQTEHHEFLVTPQEFLDNIDEVIKVTETFDITTIRASVGNYLVCKKIKEYNQTQPPENQSIVIFNGDGADEVAGGYLYHRNAPSKLDFHYESVNLLNEIHKFDVLRSDKSCSDNGLEPRTPFLDRDFVNLYMSIPIEYRFDNNKQEKYLIREAFKSDALIPEEVLLRKKEAFSDGVSIKEKSWWQIIQEYLEDKIKLPKNNIGLPFPQTGLTKEAYYYYTKFCEYYKQPHNILPNYWLPKWSGNVINPSARVLTEYSV